MFYNHVRAGQPSGPWPPGVIAHGEPLETALDNRSLFSRHPALTWLVAFLLVVLANLLWARISEVPPAWDMAYHQLKGYEFLDWFRQGASLSRIAEISPSYPPLYYFFESLVLAVAPRTGLLAFWSNLPGLFLLSFGAWMFAREYLDEAAAAWAGILPLLFPMTAWVGRESLLDGLLAGWVALACPLILRSGWFRDLGWTIAFGLVCALGVLTKWTFPVYLAVPVVTAVVVSPKRARSLLNLSVAAFLSIPIVLPYYLPNLSAFLSRYPTTNQSGLIPWKPYPRHGEPGLDNVLGWIYYPRTIASYFLFAVLTALLLFGLWRLLRRGARAGGAKRAHGSPGPGGGALLAGWLLGGMVLLIFVTPKDPRFALPLVPPLAVLLLLVWEGRRRFQALIMIVAILQFLAVSFHTPLGRAKIALGGDPGDHDYQNLQREWVLFETNYFDVTGPPEREDWRMESLLKALPDHCAVAFLPDLVRFHAGALQLAAVKAGRTIRVFKVGDTAQWRDLLGRSQYVVGKTAAQGISFITQYNSAVVAAMETGDWLVAGRWDLPDGSQAILWRRS